MTVSSRVAVTLDRRSRGHQQNNNPSRFTMTVTRGGGSVRRTDTELLRSCLPSDKWSHENPGKSSYTMMSSQGYLAPLTTRMHVCHRYHLGRLPVEQLQRNFHSEQRPRRQQRRAGHNRLPLPFYRAIQRVWGGQDGTHVDDGDDAAADDAVQLSLGSPSIIVRVTAVDCE